MYIIYFGSNYTSYTYMQYTKVKYILPILINHLSVHAIYFGSKYILPILINHLSVHAIYFGSMYAYILWK